MRRLLPAFVRRPLGKIRRATIVRLQPLRPSQRRATGTVPFDDDRNGFFQGERRWVHDHYLDAR